MRYAQRLQAIYYIAGKKIRRLIKQKNGQTPRLSMEFCKNSSVAPGVRCGACCLIKGI